MKRNPIITALVLSLVLILGACSQKSEESPKNPNSENPKEKVFTIGLEAAYPPFNWTQLNDSNGAVKINGSNEYAGGYDIEMAKRVAAKLGMKLEVEKIEWDGLTPALQSKVIDAIMAGMSPTAERKKTIDFSENYYQSTYVLVVRKDSKYVGAKSIQDFAGAKLTGQLNTTHYNVIDQIKGVKKEPAALDFASMRVALQSGVIDGYVTEVPEATSSVAVNPKFSIVSPEDGFKAELEATAVAVGLRKDDPLREKINEALSEISDEERAEIMEEAVRNQPAGK